MYPVVFEIFGHPVSSFGLMMAVAFLAGTWIAGLQFRERGLPDELAGNLMIWAMVGGILGAKLYYAVDVAVLEGRSFSDALFSRAGMVFYGGAILGVLAVITGSIVYKVPVWVTSQCTAVTLAVGQAIGRLGCFLVGDDYGVESTLPWAVAFPLGLPPTVDYTVSPPRVFSVHPTQLYEAFWLFAVATLLWKRRKSSPFLFGEFMMLNGLGRFFVEILRVNPRVGLGMSEAQWITLILFLAGMLGWIYFYRRGTGLESDAGSAPARK